MNSFEEGYRYFAKNSSEYFGTNYGIDYVKKVQIEIDKTINEMSKSVVQRTKAIDTTVKGFVAEDWHAGTFNTDVVAKGGMNTYANVDKTNNPIKDIDIISADSTNSWQSKYYKTAEDTAKELSNPKYNDVGKVAPSDQIDNDGIKNAAHWQALRNEEIRPDVSNAYTNTAENAKAVIEEAGFSSKNLKEAEALQIVKDMNDESFNPQKYGLITENFIKIDYVLHQSLKAGVTAATITSLLKIAPEIYKVIMDLIEKSHIDKDQLKKVGFVSLTAPVEGFLRGSISAAITATFASGLLGETFKTINPSLVSMVTVLVMNAIHNSIGIAFGRMSKVEFADACVRDLVVSSFALIAGSISQGLFQVPVFGFMLGSFVGSIVGIFAYETSKSLCLSFCVESGFTFFGLVKQDYKLPVEIIEEIGIKVFEYEKFTFKKFQFNQFENKPFNYKKYKVNTIGISILRRGVIGVNKIAYVPHN